MPAQDLRMKKAYLPKTWLSSTSPDSGFAQDWFGHR